MLAATVLGSGIAGLDATVVGIALPSIGRSFHGGVGTLQWVVTGYSLTLAAFLLLGGSLGDRFGRKRVFSIGIAWFALASALCGLAPNGVLLIVARVVQGIGGALVDPGQPGHHSGLVPRRRPLARDRRLVRAGRRRHRGRAARRGLPPRRRVVALGLLHQRARRGRRPRAHGASRAREQRPHQHRARGRPGATLAVAFLAGLTYGLIEGPTRGWGSPSVVAAFVIAALAGAGLPASSSTAAPNPMLPLNLFRSRQFSGANAVTFVVYGALGGALFLLPVELQIVVHYSPLASGLALLPVTVVMLVFSARSGQLSARIGPRLQMSVGPVVVGAGLALLARATTPGSYWVQVFPAVLLFGFGSGHHRGPADRDGDGRRAGRARRRRLGREQHRGPRRRARRRGRAAPGGRPDRRGRARSGGAGRAGSAPRSSCPAATCAAGGLLAVLTIRNPVRAAGPREHHAPVVPHRARMRPAAPAHASVAGLATDPRRRRPAARRRRQRAPSARWAKVGRCRAPPVRPPRRSSRPRRSDR